MVQTKGAELPPAKVLVYLQCASKLNSLMEHAKATQNLPRLAEVSAMPAVAPSLSPSPLLAPRTILD